MKVPHGVWGFDWILFKVLACSRQDQSYLRLENKEETLLEESVRGFFQARYIWDSISATLISLNHKHYCLSNTIRFCEVTSLHQIQWLVRPGNPMKKKRKSFSKQTTTHFLKVFWENTNMLQNWCKGKLHNTTFSLTTVKL